MIMWIAVDKVGTIVGFKNKPKRCDEQWKDGNNTTIFPPFIKKIYGSYKHKPVSNNYVFEKLFERNKITWEDECIWVEDSILEKNKNKFILN